MLLIPPAWYRPVGVLLGVIALVIVSQVSLLRLIDPGGGEIGTGNSRRLLGPAQIGDGAFSFGFELVGPGDPCTSVPIGTGARSHPASDAAGGGRAGCGHRPSLGPLR